MNQEMKKRYEKNLHGFRQVKVRPKEHKAIPMAVLPHKWFYLSWKQMIGVTLFFGRFLK